MCSVEKAAFEGWAKKRGGLKRKRRSAEYSHRADMYFKWRESNEFQAWLPQHASKCRGTWSDNEYSTDIVDMYCSLSG